VPALRHDGPRAAVAALIETAVDEYIPFVLLMGSLFVVSGGLRVTGAPRGTPPVNTALLALGTILAGVIGTPGASLLMLRPLIRANAHRRRVTHLFVFFILLVANVGGAFSPIGNPPLFLGYLKGVPLFWPTVHLALPTITLSLGLLASFYALDHYMRPAAHEVAVLPELEKLGIEGGVNLVLLAAAVFAIMLRLFWSSPAGLSLLGVAWNSVDIVSDLLLLGVGVASFALTAPATRRANDFTWGPLIEVAILFAAIFVTLIPVTAMMAAGEAGPLSLLAKALIAGGVPDNALFFRATGLMSAFLDNTPSYLLFFGLAGGDPARLAGPLATTLAAISTGACYFGGLTYLGNAPNLMIRAIAESHGIRMPGFLGYMGWAGVCLVPWLLLIEAIFFH
jgi:Na+/H+ antiporter NhaD/arsenite permease-like protein